MTVFAQAVNDSSLGSLPPSSWSWTVDQMFADCDHILCDLADGFALEFCTGAGAGMSRGSPAGFPAGSGLKCRKIPRYKRERDCKLRGSRGSGINFRGTPVGTGSRPHGEFKYVVLKVWCNSTPAASPPAPTDCKSQATVPVLSVTPLQWQWHLYL